MSLSTQPYKGARDFYPEDKRVQKYMFAKLREVVESFGYQEYDAPIIEPVEIYAAKSGEEIVNEQLYSFEDKGGRRVAIRPEMTPSVSRLVAGRRQELAYPLRLYSIPNLWRYERPQRGRLREHWQLNVDLFGVEGLEGDAEIIQVADTILKSFGAKPDSYGLRVNSLKAAEAVHNDLKLNNDQHRTVSRLLDKRSKMSEDEFSELLNQAVGEKLASELKSYWDKQEPPENVARLLGMLRSSGIENCIFDPEIVRGFDYYTDIVFEIYDTDPENNRSMFGGGRYDGLVGLFGVEPVPTVGFGMGDVTLQNFLQTHGLLPELINDTDAIIILIGDVYEKTQPLLAELRDKGMNLAIDATNRKMDTRIKHAEKSGVDGILFIGQNELDNGTVRAKHLKSGKEDTFTIAEIFEGIERWQQDE